MLSQSQRLQIGQTFDKINNLKDNETVISVYDGTEADMVVDFGDPKGGNIVLGGHFLRQSMFKETGFEEVEQTLKTVMYYSFKENPDSGEMEIELNQISNFNNYKVAEYTKDTLLLLPDPTLREVAKVYMKTTGNNNILVLQKGRGRVIMPTPKAIIGKVGDKDLSQMTTSEQKNYEKEDLKAYETPDTILESVVRTIDYDTYSAFVAEELASRVYAVISSAKRMVTLLQQEFGVSGDMGIHSLVKASVDYIGYKMLKSYGHPIKNSIMEDEERFKIKNAHVDFAKCERFHEMVFETGDEGFGDSRLISIFNFLDKISKESKANKNPMATLLSKKDEFKEAIGRKLKVGDLSIFDPQIGSAKGFMSAVDKVGLGDTVKIWGTELRENIQQDDPRVKIIAGVNTSLMASTISNVFFSKSHSKAGGVLMTWNNPPYSVDDGIAKATIDMYKNRTLIMGLYPTKMKNYLKNSLDSNAIIVEVPRSLTGYTDPKTPERFIVVMGRKYTAEAEAREEGREIGGVFSHSTGSITEASLDENATHDDLVRVLVSHLNGNHNFVGTKAMANMSYFEGVDWETENILYKEIERGAKETKAFYQNAEKFTKIIKSDETKQLFASKIQPLQIAKTEKVFLDTRYYSETGSYDALRFDEVVANTPLLIHYTKAMPKIMDIIETIAKEKGIKLPIDRSTINTEKFKVGEKYTGEKTKVATEKLGMMKFAFYPTDFDIQDEKSRKNILNVVKAVYKDRGRELNNEEIELLDKAMKRSNILTIKTAKGISINNETEEYLVQSKEMLVIDNDERPIPLQINNFDFYQKLEEFGFFDINDYIEVVTLSTETKKKIMENFVAYVDNVTIPDIARHNNMQPETMMQEAAKIFKESYAKYTADKNRAEAQNIAIKKANKFLGLHNYAESYLRKTPDLSLKAHVKPLLEKYFPDVFGGKSKETRQKADKYIGNLENLQNFAPVEFFGVPLTEAINALKNAIVSKKASEGAGEKELKAFDDLFVEFETDMRLAMTEIEKFTKEIDAMATRLGKTLYMSYPNVKNRITKIKELEEEGKHSQETVAQLYDQSYEAFSEWVSNVAGLMEHQIKEPENFTEMENKKTNFMLKKMRTGKTLTFVYSGILEMFTKGADMELYLNSNNIKDIASQLTQHFPMFLPSIAVFADKKKHQFREDLTHRSLYHTSAIYNPLQIKGFNTQIIGGGATMEKLGNSFSKEIEMIEAAASEKYPDGLTIDALIKDYEDSPFIEILKKAKKMCAEG